MLAGTPVLSTYRSDGMRRMGPLPLVAILPGSISEVANIVAACAMTQIPYVVRGAGTSNSGGALAVAGAALIVLTRMRRVAQVSGLELTAEAGAPLATLPPAPPGMRWLDVAVPLGTVGGHIAETAGLDNLVALELVRPDGTHVRLPATYPGYDIAGAFPGSRGKAGIAVALTLRARPS